jgi:hypothetical protein
MNNDLAEGISMKKKYGKFIGIWDRNRVGKSILIKKNLLYSSVFLIPCGVSLA